MQQKYQIISAKVFVLHHIQTPISYRWLSYPPTTKPDNNFSAFVEEIKSSSTGVCDIFHKQLRLSTI